MAPNQKKSPLLKPKRQWFLSCFGVSVNTTSIKKASKPGGRKRLFKLCLPKIKVIVIRKKKPNFEGKHSQSMVMLEANKVKHLELKHASINPKLNVEVKGSNNHHDLHSPRDQPNDDWCHKQEPTPTGKKSIQNDKLTKDSLTGASIMVITLIIMSIWGRLCAMLCIAAWLYCVPLLRVCKEATPNFGRLKVTKASKLYKKAAVLEGLFQRYSNS